MLTLRACAPVGLWMVSRRPTRLRRELPKGDDCFTRDSQDGKSTKYGGVEIDPSGSTVGSADRLCSEPGVFWCMINDNDDGKGGGGWNERMVGSTSSQRCYR